MLSNIDYRFLDIEKKWLDFFSKKKPFKTLLSSELPKYYILEMFPYPSGKIHMGHVRNYSIGDVIARFKILQGFNVLHPMGWDAFGLPAENAAIDHKIHPAKWTSDNIDHMRSQLKRMGFSYDWDREIYTAKKDYYRWGQFFFLKLKEKKLLERKKAKVNWCPACNTVLANEQVIDEHCWRHPNIFIQKKDLYQWYFKTTVYADELFDSLSKLSGSWPKKVLSMQQNWIGKSIGTVFYFISNDKKIKKIPVFTTRPDTIYGVTFLAVAFNHPEVLSYINFNFIKKEELDSFLLECKSINQNQDYEKKGYFTGNYFKHPFTGENIPLYIANFVLAEYGTGSVMGVPAHDQRDFEFAEKYNLEKKTVIIPKNKENEVISLSKAYIENGVLCNSFEFDGLDNEEAKTKIVIKAQRDSVGKKQTNYKLKDWLVSRQRYWGNPIPIFYTYDQKNNIEKREIHGVDNIPVELPEDIDFSHEKNPLLKHRFFLEKKITQTKRSKPETDTMDTFVCSSWYFLRFTDPHNEKMPFSKEIANAWMPVDLYVGGVEHACLHLLYARFFHKFLRDIGMVSSDEPFKKLLTQGMVVNESFYDKTNNRYYSIKSLEIDKNIKKNYISPDTQTPLIRKIEKMSKSKNNGVDPDEMIQKYGADTVRLFILFASPPERDLEWNEKGVEGCFRFVNRFWRWANHTVEVTTSIEPVLPTQYQNSSVVTKKMLSLHHQTIKKITEDIEGKYQFNTAIAAMMSFINEITHFTVSTIEEKSVLKLILKEFLILTSPFMPFVVEEISSLAGFGIVCQLKENLKAKWPKFNLSYIIEDKITIVLQVNGKIRNRIEIDKNIDKVKLLEIAKKDEKILQWIEKKEIIREIVVLNKLVNLVVK